MSITARYASKCGSCGGQIAVGSKVEWSKGSPARHTACGTVAPAAVSPARGFGQHPCRRCGSWCYGDC